ncbi:anti-sigma-D factor RsdA [Williamsia sp. MIQD14]|uniref:anti-sigma-D factor RsdA n=1 Tax=Williamsia sp. MIQD14 TaxID=3425703 RepID=UPI003DA019E4
MNAHGGQAHNGTDAVTVDMEAVRADDRLLDALARDQMPGDFGDGAADQQLATLLSGWRHEIDAAPMPAGPTLDEIEAEIARGGRMDSRRTAMRRLRVVAGAASVALVAFGAVTVLAQNSNPGDPLWGVKQAMFGSAASATVASADAQSNLEQAEQALSTGDKRRAAELLVQAQKKVGDMSGDDSRQRMQDWTQRLAEQVGPLPDNPLTSITSLPPVSGLPPIQLPTDILTSIIPTLPTSIPDPRTLLRAPVPPTTTPQTPPTTTQAPVTTTTVPAVPKSTASGTANGSTGN